MSLSSQLAASVMLSVSLFCVAEGQRASDMPFDEREQTQWHVLSGPEPVGRLVLLMEIKR